jgi:hypothetical protein
MGQGRRSVGDGAGGGDPLEMGKGRIAAGRQGCLEVEARWLAVRSEPGLSFPFILYQGINCCKGMVTCNLMLIYVTLHRAFYIPDVLSALHVPLH